MDFTLQLVGRDSELFEDDIQKHGDELRAIVSSSKFLVMGGAGSIGQAVVKEIFKRNPKKLHVVDISENNMVELVRDIRSSLGFLGLRQGIIIKIRGKDSGFVIEPFFF